MFLFPKQSCSVVIAFVIFLGAVGLHGCGESSRDDSTQTENVNKEGEVDMSGPEYTSAYICPMHCEGSGSDQPGKCPVCGMDYVAREVHEGDHDH